VALSSEPLRKSKLAACVSLALWAAVVFGALFMMVIVHALVFRKSVYRRAAELGRDQQIPGRAKLAAVLSLILWVGIFSAGRGIGFILAPGGLHYGVP